ncbi:MAG: DUF3617 domain-containing protein [Burkholderiales bacterium]|uniref:DUF3617 domain-containing protein n=1 Tax=Inhella sp. TaxID=1921806 RepID=UPI001AC33C46|nr:DUF3617 domain-containing protein [Burkholderiales bacterium]
MKTFLRLSVVLALPCAIAQTPPIAPGLWENVPGPTLIDGKPMPGMADMSAQLAKLPPEMRKQMEQQMNAQGVDLGSGKVRMCISAEMLKQERWQQPREGCQMEVTQRSGSEWRWKGRCTQPPGEMEGVTRFQGERAYTSQVRVSTQRQGKTQVMTMDSSARWLGADCGKLKPMVLPK